MFYDKELECLSSRPFAFCVSNVKTSSGRLKESEDKNKYLSIESEEFSALLHIGDISIEISDCFKTKTEMKRDDEDKPYIENEDNKILERTVRLNGFDYTQVKENGLSSSEIERDLAIFVDELKRFTVENKMSLSGAFQFSGDASKESKTEMERHISKISDLEVSRDNHIERLHFKKQPTSAVLAEIKSKITDIAAEFKKGKDFYGSVDPLIIEQLNETGKYLSSSLSGFSKRDSVIEKMNIADGLIKDSISIRSTSTELEPVFKLVKSNFESILNQIKEGVLQDRDHINSISILNKEIERLNLVVEDLRESARKKQEFVEKINSKRTISMASIPGVLLPMLIETVRLKHDVSFEKLKEVNEAANNSENPIDLIDYLKNKSDADIESALFFALNKSPKEISALISSDRRNKRDIGMELS